MRRTLIVVTAFLAMTMVAAAISTRMWPRINDVKTGETPEYPHLQPQRFAASGESVFNAALAAARSTGLTIVAEDRATGEIRAVAVTRIWRFKDDVTIKVTEAGNETVVNIRSASRLGKGDFGVNARRIAHLQNEIASRLGK